MNDPDTAAGGSQLQVILAGHNGDVEVLRSGEGEFTPETLSAAYARISRSPDPVPELRRRAREEVERARRSNRTIVFGLGHHSVAEHAVLNFDILGCSRLAIEALEWHRLCSYTEKSQRYITLEGDHVIPTELDPSEATALSELIVEQNRAYARLLPRLRDHQYALHPDMCERQRDRTVLDGWAKEDARYVVSLATAGQLGFTANARNLEHVVRRLRRSRLEEVRRLGDELFDAARRVAPSLIVLADEAAFREAYGTSLRDAYFRHGETDLAAAAAAVETTSQGPEAAVARRGDAVLVHHTPDPDAAVLAAMLFVAGRGSMEACTSTARAMGVDDRRQLFATAMAHLSEYDAPPRAFEHAELCFEVVIDASAMAQLKRHRMTSQLWGPYEPGLGCTVPPAVAAVGEETAFRGIVDRSSEVHDRLARSLAARGVDPAVAAYALTNAHRRRVVLTMNLREAYHFSRLREDRHAQWAIRDLAADVGTLTREAAPVCAQLLAGKDRYPEVYEQVMGRPLNAEE